MLCPCTYESLNILYVFQKVNKESLSTILSVARYSEAAYQCAQTLFEAFEGKFGVEKSIPKRVMFILKSIHHDLSYCLTFDDFVIKTVFHRWMAEIFWHMREQRR